MKNKRLLSWMLGIASLMLIGAESIHISNRNNGTEPTKIGTLIEKRESPASFAKRFHVVWEKHPTMLNKHEEFSVDADTYFKTSVGEKVIFPVSEVDYPYWQQTFAFVSSCIILLLVNAVFGFIGYDPKSEF